MVKQPRQADIDRLRASRPDVINIESGGLWWRVWNTGSQTPGWDTFRTWGPTSSRFDPHPLPVTSHDVGVLYVADSPGTALAEVFQDLRRIETGSGWQLSAFEFADDIDLLDLRGLWPTRAGGSQVISSGPRPTSRNWAQAIYDELGDQVDGLLYRSSMHGGDNAVALWLTGDDPSPLESSPAWTGPVVADRATVVTAWNLGYDIT